MILIKFIKKWRKEKNEPRMAPNLHLHLKNGLKRLEALEALLPGLQRSRCSQDWSSRRLGSCATCAEDWMAKVKKRWRDQPRLGIMDVTSNDTLFRASPASQEPAEGR